MRWLAVLVVALLGTAAFAAEEEDTPSRGLDIVYAVTTMAKTPVTAIYAAEATGLRRLLYRDADEANHVIVKIASSDLLGAARALPPRDIFAVMGPAVAPEIPGHMDAIVRLRVPEQRGTPVAPEPVLPIPLSFSLDTPYHLWNRAPLFAVSADGATFAVHVLRVGERPLELPTIRIIPTAGEEWQIPLPGKNYYASDLAFSPDGKLLAYSVLPLGDEHTLDTSQLPTAGLYLADIAARTTRLVHPSFVDALAWGPKLDQVTIASRSGDFWSTRYVASVIAVPSGRKTREFSLHGAVSALAYSDDAKWLAVQALDQTQQIWIYQVSGDWGRPIALRSDPGGRLALLGWARLAPLVGGDSEVR
jgi:hypothetical protein